jgi:O-antigen/teichoic acid export membrane protein
VSIRKNLGSLLVTQLATWVMSFLFLLVAPDRLGKVDWGAYTYAVIYVGFFVLAVGLGTNAVLTREIARDHSRLTQLVYNAVLLKLPLVLIAPAIGIPLAYAIDVRGTTLLLVSIGFIGVAFTAMSDVSLGALAGMEILARPAVYGVIQVYVASGLGLLVIVLGWGVVPFVVVVTSAAAIPCVLSWRLLWPHLHRPYHLSRTTWLFLLRAGVPLMTLTIFNTIYGSIDMPILGAITDETQVGWYGLAYRWVTIPAFISTAAVSAYFPRFSAHGRSTDHEFPRLVNECVRIVLLASVPAAIGLALISNQLIHDVYKPEFFPSIVLIQILAAHVPIAAVDTVLASALIASNRLSKYVGVSVIAAIINPIACVVLIHWSNDRYGNGAIGAAIATVGTELLILVGALMLRSPGVLDLRTSWNGLRVIAAGLTMVPVLLVADALPLLVRVALGAATYGVAIVAFRAVTGDDLRIVTSMVNARRKRPVPETID